MRILNSRLTAYVVKLAELPPKAQRKVFLLIDRLSTKEVSAENDWLAKFQTGLTDIHQQHPKGLWLSKDKPLNAYFEFNPGTLDTPIADLPFSKKLANILINMHCETLKDLLMKNPYDLSSSRNIGIGSLNEILLVIELLMLDQA